MGIYEESGSEGETDSLWDEVNVHDIERESTVVVKTVDEEREVYNAVNRRYYNQQRQKTKRYEPKFQGKWYKDDPRDMLLNYIDTLGTTRTEEGKLNIF